MDARSRLEAFFRVRWADVDMRPNSVFGDLILEPLSYWFAAQEVAAGRIMSDLQLQQISQNVIYNCDFVQEYIKNFGVSDYETPHAWGVIRLGFSSDVERTLDRKLEFLFGTDGVFRMILPYEGAMILRPVGAQRVEGANDRVYSQVAADLFVVDIPVEGDMPTDVLSGNTGAISKALPGLTQLAAIGDFQSGLPPAKLAELAALASKISASAVPSSRAGISALAHSKFPDLLAVSPAFPGDTELIRDELNLFGAPDRKADLYVRTKRALHQETITVRLDYREGEETFYGRVRFPGIPARIVAVSRPEEVGLDPVWYSQSTAPEKAPLLSAAYSEYEALWLTVPMPKDGSDNALLTPLGTAPDRYLDFEIAYEYDPHVPAVLSYLLSDQHSAVSVDMMGRTFIPCFIDGLDVRYRRKRGFHVNLPAAREEITEYVNGVAWPDRVSEAKIIDAMLYAGAYNVDAISLDATTRMSVADRYLPHGEILYGTDQEFTEAVAASEEVPVLGSASIPGLVPDFRHLDSYSAAGLRNVSFFIYDINVNFEEV